MFTPASGIYRFGKPTLDLAGSLPNAKADALAAPKSFAVLTYLVTGAGRFIV
jgi:hypothetical protein